MTNIAGTQAVWLLMAITIAYSHRILRAKGYLPPGAERCKSLRRCGNPVLIHIALPDAKPEAATGTVMDRSAGGLGIVSEKEFGAGVILIVRPASACDPTPWCPIEVLACCKVGDTWRLNCRFVSRLPNPMLLLFG
jgi:hypothetical protein